MRSPFEAGLGFVAAVTVLASACASGAPTTPRPAGAHNNPLLEDVARRCARVVACADAHDASQFRDPSTCVDWWLVNVNDERPLADCVMRASSCAGLHACTHEREDATAAAYCLSHPGVFSACDGSRFISCEGDGGKESTSQDCEAQGGVCGQRESGGLVVRGCVSPKICPPAAPERRCEGGALVSCEGGIFERVECQSGTRCVAGVDESGAPTASCEAVGAVKCTSSSTARCEGDAAVACVVNGRYPGVHRTNCADYGLTCAARGGRTSCVARQAPACAVGAPARCDGDDLVFCAGGTVTRVSCKSLGLAGCADDGKGPAASCRAIE